MSLIAATAIGLSVVGCESGDSGGIQDTTDLIQPINNSGTSLREYLLVGQRGLEIGDPQFLTGQSAPANVNTVFVGPADESVGESFPQLWELFGISDTPRPNATLGTPGNAQSAEPTTPNSALFTDADGAFHELIPSPGGLYAIGISRARGHGFVANDPVRNALFQVFSMQLAPADVQFPPSVSFSVPADPVSRYFFPVDQGEFVSGAWGSSGQQFYAGINGAIQVIAFEGISGRTDFVQAVPFPTGASTVNNIRGNNNPVKIIASPNNQFIYALDNANSQIVVYARNQADGTLTQAGVTAVPIDPRGMALDRTGTFLYVAGRTSEQLAGYRIAADGTLSAIDLFPDLALGAVPFNIGDPLGDVATNPRTDALFLTTYLGVMQAYTIDPASGALRASGQARTPLGNARNAANIEVDPTGRFVVGAYEDDRETYFPYANPGNGFPYDEGAVFTNISTATNTVSVTNPVAIPLSPTPMLDTSGRVVFTSPIPDGQIFQGQVQVWRIEDSGSPRAESTGTSLNPYGLNFFQRVIPVPTDGNPPQP